MQSGLVPEASFVENILTSLRLGQEGKMTTLEIAADSCSETRNSANLVWRPFALSYLLTPLGHMMSLQCRHFTLSTSAPPPVAVALLLPFVILPPLGMRFLHLRPKVTDQPLLSDTPCSESVISGLLTTGKHDRKLTVQFCLTDENFSSTLL